MPDFDMVIFDCDGVLVDSEPISNGVMQRSLARYGLPLPLDEVMRIFVGGTLEGGFMRAKERGADLPADWVSQIDAEICVALEAQAEAITGVVQVLDALEGAGIPYAVASNGPHRKMGITLGCTGLKARFDGRIYSADDVKNPKPAPDVYLKAATDAGVGPARCAVIEDSASGARAGKAAGMAVFGFAADTPADRLRPVCDQIFDKMAELPRLLGV